MPEPVLLSIAASLATRAVAGLYELVRNRFADDPVATAVLAAADGAPADSPQVTALGAVLERATEADPAFAEALRREHEAGQSGQVINSISGTVTGTAVQARDIHGGISFG